MSHKLLASVTYKYNFYHYSPLTNGASKSKLFLSPLLGNSAMTHHSFDRPCVTMSLSDTS